jgi:hypothetical protein
MKAEDLLTMPRRELHALLEGGHPIDPRALDDTEYEGVSLGLPPLAVKLSWLTFRKTFHRDPKSGALRGWNVRMEQTGLHGPRVAMKDRRGEPRCFGFYEVLDARGYRMPVRCEHALMIDYGRAAQNHALDPIRRGRDPLVALRAGSTEQLLGWTYLDLGPFDVGTPSYFLLEREGPLSYVPQR